MKGRANITIAPNVISHIGFKLPLLELTLTHSNRQFGGRNDVSPNIFGLVFSFSYSFMFYTAQFLLSVI